MSTPSITRLAGISGELSLLAANCVVRDLDDIITNQVKFPALPWLPYMWGVPDKSRMLAMTPSEFHAYLYSYKNFKVSSNFTCTQGYISMVNRVASLGTTCPLALYPTPPTQLPADRVAPAPVSYTYPGGWPGLVYDSTATPLVGVGAGSWGGGVGGVQSEDTSDGSSGFAGVASEDQGFFGGPSANIWWTHDNSLVFFSKTDQKYYVVPTFNTFGGITRNDPGVSSNVSVFCAPFACSDALWVGDSFGHPLVFSGGPSGASTFSSDAGTLTIGDKTVTLCSAASAWGYGYTGGGLPSGSATVTVTPGDPWDWTS